MRKRKRKMSKRKRRKKDHGQKEIVRRDEGNQIRETVS